MNKLLQGLRVLVTRPADQASVLLDEIKKLEGQAVGFPLLSIEPVITKQIDEQLQRLHQAQDIICVSANAAREGLSALHRVSIAPPKQAQWFAIGEATARVLRDAGIAVETPQTGVTSEDFINMPCFAQIEERRIIIWRGAGGRELLGDTLKARGAHVEYIELYQRVLPRYAQGALDDVMMNKDINVIVISSGEGLVNLCKLIVQSANLEKIKKTLLLVPSQRVVDQAKKRGFIKIACSQAADDQSVVRCLQEACS